MEKLIRTENLGNGILVKFFDLSNRYYGDFHRVKIEVRCTLPLGPECFAGAADPQAETRRVRGLLGNNLFFTRSLEKMGVAGGDLEAVKQTLVDSFISSTFHYLASAEFAPRLVASELAKMKKVRRPAFVPR